MNSEESDVSLHSTNLRLCDVKENNYALVRFITKTAETYYVGQVMEVDEKDEELQITFMTRMQSCQGNVFCFPDVEYLGVPGIENVVLLLPQPQMRHYFAKCRTF